MAKKTEKEEPEITPVVEPEKETKNQEKPPEKEPENEQKEGEEWGTKILEKLSNLEKLLTPQQETQKEIIEIPIPEKPEELQKEEPENKEPGPLQKFLKWLV